MKKNFICFLLTICLLFSCKWIEDNSENKNLNKHLVVKGIKIQDRIDTIISTPEKIALSFSYCDLIRSKGFKEIKPKNYDIANVDSLSYGFKIGNDTLIFTHQFSKSSKEKTDRNLIYKGKSTQLKRIILKDSIPFEFTGFMCDYKNAKFLSNDRFILIKSQPSNWSGLMNKFEFYQIIDKYRIITYEIFLNEEVNCK